MTACHRGSVSPSGAAPPGRIASAAAMASSTVMIFRLRPLRRIVDDRVIDRQRLREAVETREEARARDAHLKQIAKRHTPFAVRNHDLEEIVFAVVTRKRLEVRHERLREITRNQERALLDAAAPVAA